MDIDVYSIYSTLQEFDYDLLGDETNEWLEYWAGARGRDYHMTPRSR